MARDYPLVYPKSKYTKSLYLEYENLILPYEKIAKILITAFESMFDSVGTQKVQCLYISAREADPGYITRIYISFIRNQSLKCKQRLQIKGILPKYVKTAKTLDSFLGELIYSPNDYDENNRLKDLISDRKYKWYLSSACDTTEDENEFKKLIEDGKKFHRNLLVHEENPLKRAKILEKTDEVEGLKLESKKQEIKQEKN
jgi:hypothetical protein